MSESVLESALEKCGMCGCTDLSGGSWTPDRCNRCGAFNSGNQWYYDENAVPSNEKIRKQWAAIEANFAADKKKFTVSVDDFKGESFNSIMASGDGRRLWASYKDGEHCFMVEDLSGKIPIFKTIYLEHAVKIFNEM